MKRQWWTAGVGAVGVIILGCTGDATEPRALGPADGHELPATDLERVRVGVEAPDFTLESHSHGRITLSDLRGEKTVVLVFYRGHW